MDYITTKLIDSLSSTQYLQTEYSYSVIYNVMNYNKIVNHVFFLKVYVPSCFLVLSENKLLMLVEFIKFVLSTYVTYVK